jgi:hypothetical protein
MGGERGLEGSGGILVVGGHIQIRVLAIQRWHSHYVGMARDIDEGCSRETSERGGIFGIIIRGGVGIGIIRVAMDGLGVFLISVPGGRLDAR